MPLLFFLAWLAPLAAEDAFTGKYCVTCHSAAAKAGGLVLSGLPSENAAARPDIWEKVVKRMRAGEMPPLGAPRPNPAVATAFWNDLVTRLDRAEPYAGRPVIRRLNRTEYRHAVRDLLGLDLPLDGELPADQSVGGFDNIADALSLSPLLLERYLKVARRVSQLATGTADTTPVTEIFPAKGPQGVWQGEGMPYGTRGGIRVQHYFPHDGDYDLRAFLAKESLTPLEGVRFFRTRLRVTAGTHSVVVTFPDEFAEREGPVSDVGGPGGAALGGPLDVLGTAVRPTLDFRLDGKRVKLFEIRGMTAGEAAFDGQPGPPALARIEIAGPYNASTPQRQAGACSDQTPACAERTLQTLVRRAYRRDVTAADVAPFLKTFTRERAAKSFAVAMAAAIRDLLIAPDFLFRLEFDHPSGAVNDFELASRLSFFLWSSIPDDALLQAASQGTLRGNEAIGQQVSRMLADPKASALIDIFIPQWLGLNTLPEEPDRALFPSYDRALASAFSTETRLFTGSLVRENRPVLDLIRANYTYLNNRLAEHYGIPGILGPGFRRVTFDAASGRGGLLTHGSVLLLTSHATRTSPVLRGKWILTNLLNSPPPQPPANVPPLEDSAHGNRKLTARQLTERHRANAACASCHNRIDPLGFALENYDVIGRRREQDDGVAIDASTTLPNGQKMNGAAGLRDMLTGRADELAHATVERLLTYATGRELDPRDQPAVRAIVRASAPGGYRFHDLIAGVARSAPFRLRQKQEPSR